MLFQFLKLNISDETDIFEPADEDQQKDEFDLRLPEKLDVNQEPVKEMSQNQFKADSPEVAEGTDSSSHDSSASGKPADDDGNTGSKVEDLSDETELEEEENDGPTLFGSMLRGWYTTISLKFQ